MTVLLYDVKRDGAIPLGTVLTVYEDGHTELNKIRREYSEPRTERKRAGNTKRSIPIGIIEHNKGNIRQAPAGKRTALRPVRPAEQVLSTE